MKIFLASDLHREAVPIELTPPEGTELIVLAGDIDGGCAGIEWAKTCFPDLPVVYVPGNHEFYGTEIDEAISSMREAAAGSNVHLLEQDVLQWGGVRFAGATLWTDFALHAAGDAEEMVWSMVAAGRFVPDFDGRIRALTAGRDVPFSAQMAQGWHRQTVAWLSRVLAEPFSGRTVVVTHHAPSAHSVPPFYQGHAATPAYASNLEPLVGRADLWLHGHMHDSCRYEIGNCRVICNPAGFGGENRDFDGAMLIDI